MNFKTVYQYQNYIFNKYNFLFKNNVNWQQFQEKEKLYPSRIFILYFKKEKQYFRIMAVTGMLLYIWLFGLLLYYFSLYEIPLPHDKIYLIHQFLGFIFLANIILLSIHKLFCVDNTKLINYIKNRLNKGE